MKFNKIAVDGFDRLLGFFAFLAGAIILLIMLAINFGVASRLSGLGSMLWISEFTDYCLLWIGFLGAAWVLRAEGHVGMDMLLHQLSPKNQNLFNMITSAVSAIACLVLTCFSGKVTWHHFETHYLITRFIDVPSYPIIGIIPLGSLLLVIQFIRRTRKFYKAWKGLL